MSALSSRYPDPDRRRISPKEMAQLGWTRGAKKPWHFGRNFLHKDGWQIQHCGHPTALWPYLLVNPAGKWILTGARGSGDPQHGTAWPTVAAAVDFVASEKSAKYVA